MHEEVSCLPEARRCVAARSTPARFWGQTINAYPGTIFECFVPTYNGSAMLKGLLLQPGPSDINTWYEYYTGTCYDTLFLQLL